MNIHDLHITSDPDFQRLTDPLRIIPSRQQKTNQIFSFFNFTETQAFWFRSTKKLTFDLIEIEISPLRIAVEVKAAIFSESGSIMLH